MPQICRANLDQDLKPSNSGLKKERHQEVQHRMMHFSQGSSMPFYLTALQN